MLDHDDSATPARWARVAGASLLLILLCSLTSNDLVVGDASSTANNIADHEFRFRVGLLGELLMINADIVLAVALYMLLKPIHAGLALLGAFWRVGNVVLQATGVVVALVALDVLDDKHGLAAFHVDQLQHTARQLFDMHSTAMLVGLVFFALGAGTHAWLLWVSRYIPRLLSGAYLLVSSIIFAGCCGIVLFPGLDTLIDPWFILPDAAVELVVALWLLIKGVRLVPRRVAGPA